MMKFSRAISRAIWLSGENTNVSKTISLLVLRILVWQWLGKNILTKYIPGQVCLSDRSVGRFDGRFAWIKVVCEQQLGYGVPGPAQCEAIVPVDVIFGWLLWRGGPYILMLCPTLRRWNWSVFLCWCFVLLPHIPPVDRTIYFLYTPCNWPL